MVRGLFIVGICCWMAMPPAAASMAEFQPLFDPEIEQKQGLPSQEDIEKLALEENTLYAPRYTSVFDLGDTFDRDFYQVIATRGKTEKRLKWEDEDAILEMLNSLPREMYPYIGPMLFEIPNMSDKILNLPGIKETKNQFPQRIAEQLKDIEDIVL